MSKVYHDAHTLYVRCGGGTEEQVRNCFKTAISECSKLLGIDGGRFRVNYVCDRNNKAYDLAFVYILRPEIYFTLLGLNTDGSEKVILVPDASWIPPPEGEYIEGVTEIKVPAAPVVPVSSGWSDFNITDCWADMDDDFDAVQQVAKEKARRTRPLLSVKCPSPITFPSFFVLQEKEGEKGPVEVSSTVTIDRAMVYDVESACSHHVLKSRDVPFWVNNDDIYKEFLPYATITKEGRYNYPFVKRDNGGNVTITFSPQTRDAQFAMFMMKKFFFAKKMKNGELQKVLLFCSYAPARKHNK